MENIELKELPVDSLVHNPHNPNIMEEKEWEKLKFSIKQVGYIEPIVVVPHIEKDKFLILDGAHRVLAFQELFPDKKMIPAIVASNLEYAVAYATPYTMNVAKGKVIPQKVAEMITNGLMAGLGLDIEKISKITGIPKDYINEYTAMMRTKEAEVITRSEVSKIVDVKTQIIQQEQKELISRPIENLPKLLMVTLPYEIYGLVSDILNKINASDWAEGVEKVFKSYKE